MKPKKHLGQHFLRDDNIARKIAATLSGAGYEDVLEIGPGTGVLTKLLLNSGKRLTAVETDPESVAWLRERYSGFRLVEADFLEMPLADYFGDAPFAVIGNFPYNISSQIVFKALKWRRQIPELAGMFQREVAERICEKPGTRVYGILSVLTQAFYQAEYLFSVPPGVFHPPPKVESGVIRLTRRAGYNLPCDEALFFRVVKTAFNQRRKTLRNSLKPIIKGGNLSEDTIFGERPEQLSAGDFIRLTQKIERDAI